MKKYNELDQPFDHSNFIRDYKRSIQNKNFRNLRSLRQIVQKQTINAQKKNRYVFQDEVVHLFSSEEERKKYVSERETFKAEDISEFPNQEFKNEECEIDVVNDDCLVCFLRLKNEGFKNVCVLNMANASTPGGGFQHGCGAQEENIMRRTTLYTSFYDPFKDDPRNFSKSRNGKNNIYSTTNNRTFFYPLPLSGGCFCKVKVFRDSEQNGYALLKEPVPCDIVSVAAIRRPKLMPIDREKFLSSSDPLTKEEERMMGNVMLTFKEEMILMKKIEAILRIARKKKCEAIVLSAFGCGAFRNPAFHVAYVFRKVIELYKFDFKKIVFAILEDHNSKHVSDVGNYLPFEFVFSSDLFKQNGKNEKE